MMMLLKGTMPRIISNYSVWRVRIQGGNDPR